MGGTISKPDPSRTIEVIGAGASRTGTSSLQLGLEKLLDGPVYHGGTHVYFSDDDAHMRLWGQAIDAKYRDKDKERTQKILRQILKGYAGCLDAPVNMFLEELVDLYPDAKFVLTTRDPVKWWQSLGNIIGYVPWYLNVLIAPTPGLRWVGKVWEGFQLQCQGLLRDYGRDPNDYGPELLTAWNESVINTVPRERLMIMEIKEGWAPLAKFLGKTIPDEPFPRVNETAVVNVQAKWIFVKLFGVWMGVLSVTGGSAYVAWKLWKR